MNSLVLAATLMGVSAHMAVLDPIPLDAAIGDAYRHPVSSGLSLFFGSGRSN